MSNSVQSDRDFGVRRFGAVNWLGLWTLMRRENMRYFNIWQQTVFAPLITGALFLLIFSIAIGPDRADVMGRPFLEFLAPGLVMMTVIQNAFANTSSSLVSSKVTGNIIDTLMPPLSPLEIVLGYISGGVGRAVMLGVAMYLAMGLALGIWLAHPVWALTFVFFGGVFMASLGMMAGLYATKFDQMAAITNFVITPLAFLSGTFYSVTALPDVLEQITRMNPMFYIIDGGRHGALGVSDASPWLALAVVAGAAVVNTTLCWLWVRSGYRIKP
ncbi:MAG: ABC transporter permease [Pseudomonadota bacterium]